jgi:hypothetical protein
MYSKALVGYKKVIGPNYPKYQSQREILQVLNTIVEKETMKG